MLESLKMSNLTVRKANFKEKQSYMYLRRGFTMKRTLIRGKPSMTHRHN